MILCIRSLRTCWWRMYPNDSIESENNQLFSTSGQSLTNFDKNTKKKEKKETLFCWNVYTRTFLLSSLELWFVMLHHIEVRCSCCSFLYVDQLCFLNIISSVFLTFPSRTSIRWKTKSFWSRFSDTHVELYIVFFSRHFLFCLIRWMRKMNLDWNHWKKKEFYERMHFFRRPCIVMITKVTCKFSCWQEISSFILVLFLSFPLIVSIII